MHPGFRAKAFLAVFGGAAVALLLLATLTTVWLAQQTYGRIERSLTAEARLVAEILSHHPLITAGLDEEADRLGKDLGARVTLIAADGQVIGDSSVGRGALASLGNHADRPEVIEARRNGLGLSRRYSQTLRSDLLYVAVATRHPSVAVVRLALPLTEIQHQASSVRQAALLALGVALVGALALAWVSSALLVRRITAIATAARRYSGGDLSQPVRDYGNDELGTVARVLDETVRELARRLAEIARDRARTEAVLAGMAEGVLAVDAEGRVELANAAARSMLGLEDSPVSRHYLESIRHPGVARLLTTALDGEGSAGLELTPARNPERRIVARAAPVTGPGGAGAVLVLHDITDLRLADQVRRDFVANVSHELRTPLTAIRGYVEALRDEPADSGERQRFIEIIARHANRMERLVKDLLRLASLEARQEFVERAPCDVAGLFGSVAADLASSVNAKNQRIEISVGPPVATLDTDAGKLQDALRNLVENAVNYSPPDGTIRLEASAGANGRVLITVADEGPGIPEADLLRIFERFYRVDKARSRESGGTGLGLSIVRHLVELFGGDVRAANRPEGGAIFTVTLPPDVLQTRGSS